MTRKRFEKKLMGLGYSRNRAQALASSRPSFLTYEHWLGLCSTPALIGTLVCSIASMAKALLGFSSAVTLIGHACREVPKNE